jgi:hypothetical protein
VSYGESGCGDTQRLQRGRIHPTSIIKVASWSHRTIVRNKPDHLLAGLLFDDTDHRMIPTHATKAGIRYVYYASAPVLHGEAKTAPAGSGGAGWAQLETHHAIIEPVSTRAGNGNF